MAELPENLASCVIFGLDGTLLNTAFEAAAVIVEDYGLPGGNDELLDEITPVFSALIGNIKVFPGLDRLLKHLSDHGEPMALASNYSLKLFPNGCPMLGWKEYFSVIIGGDEATAGKPSPEMILEAAKRLNMELSSCLVIVDSVTGVMASKAAGMKVVAVPSVPRQTHLSTAADEVIHSLLDLRPD
ncbi:hypothetical protein SLE2022_013560 [Rubroshorea leprosula]